jgi:hypothetical protein
MNAGSNGQNWTAWHRTLDEAMAAANRVYGPREVLVRQEIIDTATGEWRFRGGGHLDWSGPTRGRPPDTLRMSRPDKRLNEQADGTWSFYCPHGVGDVDVKLFPNEVMARQYSEAHDRAIHHGDSDNVFKHEHVR